jgi:hypothetical protein
MLVKPPQSAFDPEFDSPPSPRAESPQDLPVSDGNRLIVNPILVLGAWVGSYWLLRAAILSVNFFLFAMGATLLVVSFFLLRYYCIDCGGAGWLIRYKRHTCREDMRRRHLRLRRWRVPVVAAQVLAWCYFVAAVVILWLILTRA